MLIPKVLHPLTCSASFANKDVVDQIAYTTRMSTTWRDHVMDYVGLMCSGHTIINAITYVWCVCRSI